MMSSDFCEKQRSSARRIVISGPEGFNQAVREMATGTCGVDSEEITILEAQQRAQAI